MAVAVYHKYRACFSSQPFSQPIPFDCNIGLSTSPPGNTTTNNQNFVNHYYNQSGGFVLVPGTFIRLYDAFYPQFFTCYEYLGTSLTPEIIYVEFIGGHALQNSGYFIEPYGDCSTCEIDPSVFAYDHSWRYCDNSLAFNPVPVVPLLGFCFLPNTETNVQIAQNELTAVLGPISIGDVVQLSDGTCMYYEGVQSRPTSYDIDASNNPASGNWHAGYAPGNCGNAFGTPPTRGLIGSIADCQVCPATTTTTTGIQPITTTTTTYYPATTSTTTVAPITTTTTTCYNCCTTTTTGGPCPTCGIESCCQTAGPPVQYNATGNLLSMLNSLNCDNNYAFQIPNLLVSGSIVRNECWKPICNPDPTLAFANMVETMVDLSTAGLINTLGCAQLTVVLASTLHPCCDVPVTTTTTGPPTTTTTTVFGTTTTTTYSPTTTTTTVWYECITPPLPPSPGTFCSTLPQLPPGPGWNCNTASDYLIDERISGNIAIGTPLQSHYWEEGTPSSGNQCATPTGERYANANVIHGKLINGVSTNILYNTAAFHFSWQSWIDYLNSVTPATYTYVMSRATVLSTMRAYSHNLNEGWAYMCTVCMCFQPPCYCIPCLTPMVGNCIYTDFNLCDVAANATPCCQPITTTTTTSPTTTTTTRLAIGLELCCPPYDQYLVTNGTFLWTLINPMNFGTAHIFELTLPNGSVIQACAQVISNPSPINVISNGFLWNSPSTDMDCATWSAALQAGTYYFPGMEDGCCELDYYECITPAPLIPGVNASFACEAGDTYVIVPNVSQSNNFTDNQIEFVDYIVSSYGHTAILGDFYYINPTQALWVDGCDNYSVLYNGNGQHETVNNVYMLGGNVVYILGSALSTWQLVIDALNAINLSNSWPQNFQYNDTFNQVIVKMVANAPGEGLILNWTYCGCFNPCYCQSCVPPAPNCIYTNIGDCNTAASATPCCNPTTTTTTVYCDRLGLEDCCPPYDQWMVTPGTPLYTIITNATYIPNSTVLALTVSDINGVIITSCFQIIDTACPGWPILTGGWTTPQLPPASFVASPVVNCATCLGWLAGTPWYYNCSVTTTTTQWWECVTPPIPTPGVDADWCDTTHTLVSPAGVSIANSFVQNQHEFINEVVSIYGPSNALAEYFYINPSTPNPNPNICVNNDPAIFNGTGEYQKVTGFIGAVGNTAYILTGQVTSYASWFLLIIALNDINAANSWPVNFVIGDTWNGVITKMQANAPNDNLIPQVVYCMCTQPPCYCQVCSSGPNCIYPNEPLCLVSANATPCCETTTYAPSTTTTTTSNLVGVRLCCAPYTEYEVIYNSSLYNLIDYSFSPFNRAFVMTITLPNSTTLTACMQMEMNIPPGSPQLQAGVFVSTFSPTNYYVDCVTLDYAAITYGGWGFVHLESGCCPATTTTTTSSVLGLEECCDPFAQYVATGLLLTFIQTYNVGQAFYGTLSGPSMATPQICFKIITNPSGLIADSGNAVGPADNCVDINTYIINAQLSLGCCPTTTTTTYPTTTTTTTNLCPSCDVLLVDSSSPPKVYNYNHTTNQTNLLFTATQNISASLDIARYGNLIWVYNSQFISEYSIDPITCNVTWVREITLLEQIGAGLTAIDATTLIGGSIQGALLGNIDFIDITTNTAVLSNAVTLAPTEYVAGDLLYLAGTNTLIVAVKNPSTGYKLDYYDLSNGALLGSVSSSPTWGLYCYNNFIYGVTDIKEVYPIYVTSSSILAGSPLQVIPNPPPSVWGAASDPRCCEVTTTTTIPMEILGIELCCSPYTTYVATGSLLSYISSLSPGDAFAAYFVINNMDIPLCVKVINNATGPNLSSYSLICNPHPMTCNALNAHLIAYNPPGHGVVELELGCCSPDTSTTTTEYVMEDKYIRACCPNVDGSYNEYRPTPGSNLDNMLNIAVVGTFYELTVLPLGGSPQQSQCYVVIASSLQFQDADGYTTLNMSFQSCGTCNSSLPGPLPTGCLQLPS